MNTSLVPATAEAYAGRIRVHQGKAVESIVAMGQEFIEAKDRLPHGEFQRLALLVGITDRSVRYLMTIADNQAIANRNHGSVLPASWRTLAELARLDADRLDWAIERGAVTPDTDRQKAQAIVKEYLALEIVAPEPKRPKPKDSSKAPSTFNAVNDNIGWARWSWNPVTGCLHNCDYCYARDIAERFYPEKFAPTFHPERLAAPENTAMPASAVDDPAWRRVFTCSMADLFGKWVKQAWIKAVFDQMVAAPQWEYLCLTKFPQRLAELDWPSHVWAGTTVDRQDRVAVAEKSFKGVKAGVKWLSCEPLLEPLTFKSLAMFDWVVIGASTGSSQAAPVAPQFDWVADLVYQARRAGCRVYLKHNLFGSTEGRTPGMQPLREWPGVR